MSWTQPAFEAIAELLGKQTGLSFVNREASAEIGMRRAMARARITAVADYLERIAGPGDALDDLITELTVGETYFFREPAHFRAIERTILPDIRQRRGSQHPLRIWSAGCASGEEAYSLAMLLEDQGATAESHVFATDIARAALAKARQACFGEWSLRNEESQAARRYLTHAADGYHVSERIRRRVTLAHLNLALDAYPSFATGIWGMDLILCRNVLIYLDRATVRNVARRLHQTLADGGWLITASADPPLWDLVPLEVIQLDEGLVYQRAGEAQSQFTAAEPDVITAPFPEVALTAPVDAPRVEGDSICQAGNDLADARASLKRGEHARAVALTADLLGDAAAATLHVRALANVDSAAAENVCAQALRQHRFCVELHYLHAVLLMELRRDEAALDALRRVLYLDRTLAVAHFTLGSLLRQRGDTAGAARAFRNVRTLCMARSAEEAVPFSDGESAGRLAEVAAAELALLEGVAASSVVQGSTSK